MSTSNDHEVERYFYRSASMSTRHRNRVSAYFVELRRGAKVIAHIEPLGLVPTSIGDEQLAIQRLRRNLAVAGAWQETPSGHHVRQRVTAVASIPTMKVAPQSS
jgi:hypothetical protein